MPFQLLWGGLVLVNRPFAQVFNSMVPIGKRFLFLTIFLFFSYSCEIKNSHIKNNKGASDGPTGLASTDPFHNRTLMDTIFNKSAAKEILIDSTLWMNGADTVLRPQEETLFLNTRWEVISRESFLDSVLSSNYGSSILTNVEQEKAHILRKIISYEGKDPIYQDLVQYEDFSLADIPDSLFMNLNGKGISKTILDKKVVVLNFWFIGCKGCMIEIPFLNDLVEKYKNNKEVIFLAPATDTPAELMDFSLTNTFKYTLLAVKDKALNESTFKIRAFPTNMIIGRDGKVKYVSQGGSAVAVKWLDLAVESVIKRENDEVL